MSKQAEQERNEMIVKTSLELAEAEAIYGAAKEQAKAAREEVKRCRQRHLQATTADYETLFNQDQPNG